MAVTFTYDEGCDANGVRRGLRKVIASWTSNGTGDASGTAKMVGTLVKATTNPADGPTDNYDITLTDEDGIDLLTACQNNLTNRDTSNSEEVYFLVLDTAATPLAQSIHPVVCGDVTVTIAAAGATKSGVLNLYFRD